MKARHLPPDDATYLRRVDFLLAEARSPNPQYDEAVRKTLRCVSDYATVGRMGDMRAHNHLMSRSAFSLAKELGNLTEWKTQVTSEHRLELVVVWNSIVEEASQLAASTVWERLKQSPFYTITRVENSRLKSHVGRDLINPEQRYLDAGIEVGTAPNLWVRGKRNPSLAVWKPEPILGREAGPIND